MAGGHEFPWRWWLSDLAKVRKSGLKVFSCFSCGGGSSMGYKLAGFDVVGNCEIDPDMEALYVRNQHPEHTFQMDIRDFNKLGEYPGALNRLDVLDGSPPCSTFSTSGDRDKAWGKEKVFREGQTAQRLDDLFFHFIETARILRPKAVVAENVKGLLLGKARGYVNAIVNGFKEAGYDVQIFLLDAAKMGVPQRRERTFFLARRNDLGLPKIALDVDEPPITFGEVRSPAGIPLQKGLMKGLILKRRPGDRTFCDISLRERGKKSMFNDIIAADGEVAPTLSASGVKCRYHDGHRFSREDCVAVQTFPQDYDFGKEDPAYVCGMSVPPVMMARIAAKIRKQWFGL